MFRLVASAAAMLLAMAHAASSSSPPLGVCYSPAHASASADMAAVLRADMAHIAAQGFGFVRTYNAQYDGVNVALAAHEAGLQVAIGVQMQAANGSTYASLEDDIAAAVEAAKRAPESVLAIYAGNENLQDGTTGNRLVEVITRIKSELQGTPGADVPVGTVQRLHEWLTAPDAAKVAAASDVVGANIYPFFTYGGQADMQGTLDTQWTQFATKYGRKARLTETGWPSSGSATTYGNVPSTSNAHKYFSAFRDWATASDAVTPFYFMMYDVPSAPGDDYEQHFGLATDAGVLKFPIAVASTLTSNTARETRSMDVLDVSASKASTSGSHDASATATETPLAPPEPSMATLGPEIPEPATFSLTPETLEPMTEAPTFTPTHAPVIDFSSSSTGSGSGAGGADVVFPPASVMPPADSSFSGSGFGSSSTAGNGDHDVGEGSDGDAGVAPKPTTPAMPSAAPAPTGAATPGTPAPTSLTPQASEDAARAANSRVARDVSGDSGTSFYVLATGIGGMGCVAVIVIAVYMRRRNETDGDETRTVAASSIDRRGSTQSVYDDPLGTRFSSIVMITPNGDGVCIL